MKEKLKKARRETKERERERLANKLKRELAQYKIDSVYLWNEVDNNWRLCGTASVTAPQELITEMRNRVRDIDTILNQAQDALYN
jgi:energy-converting hydrogenase Eha subunit F